MAMMSKAVRKRMMFSLNSSIKKLFYVNGDGQFWLWDNAFPQRQLPRSTGSISPNFL